MSCSHSILRRACGVLGIAASWSIVWAAVFAALGSVIWMTRPQDFDAGESLLVVAGFSAVVGFASGTVYGVILALVERRRTITELAIPRVCVWGALASAVWPVLITAKTSMVVVLCPLGAICAVAAVALVRRAERTDTWRSSIGRWIGRAVAEPLRWVCTPIA